MRRGSPSLLRLSEPCFVPVEGLAPGALFPIQNNFTDTQESQSTIDGINGSVIANNAVVTDGNWPTAAQQVIDEAGRSEAPRGIRESWESCWAC